MDQASLADRHNIYHTSLPPFLENNPIPQLQWNLGTYTILKLIINFYNFQYWCFQTNMT